MRLSNHEYIYIYINKSEKISLIRNVGALWQHVKGRDMNQNWIKPGENG